MAPTQSDLVEALGATPEVAEENLTSGRRDQENTVPVPITACWTVQHAVELGRHILRPGRVAVTGAEPAGHLGWQLAQLGAVVQIHAGRIAHPVDQCRSCAVPLHLHCPGCGSCLPGYRCAPGCTAAGDEVDQSVALIEEWQRRWAS